MELPAAPRLNSSSRRHDGKIPDSPEAWADFQYWVRTDVRARDKVNTLIEDIQRNPFTGLGKPEPFKRNLSGGWSRRITREHHLVYRVNGGELPIAQCRYHY